MIIAIDGPSGAGKGTVAKRLAAALGFAYFDTGAMYRAFAYATLKAGVDLEDSQALEAFLQSFDYRVSDGRYFVGSEEVTSHLRTPDVTKRSSVVATIPQVRHAMVKVQRTFAHGNAVFEGRDIGTVVFPDADVKFFLTASPEERARRRFLQWEEKVSQGEVLRQQEERDRQDETRAHSPLRPAPDAQVVDTTHLSIEEVVEALLGMIES